MKKALLLLLFATTAFAQKTQKPPLHGAHWMAVTGKPLAATAGAMIFERGGNAVDAAAAMIAATCTMRDTLSWGGETQALIYDPHAKKVVGINALGVAPTGATAAFFHAKGMKYPPEYGPLAGRHPGDGGGVREALAEGCPRAGDRDGGRLSDRARARRHDSQIQSAPRRVAVLE